MDIEEARKVVRKMNNRARDYFASIGATNVVEMLDKDPDYFRRNGAKGGAKTKALFQDEEFRAEHARRMKAAREKEPAQ